MGFCCGTIVQVIRRAPFGDPIELRLRGYELCLRHEQASCIRVAHIAIPSGESPIDARKTPASETGFQRILRRVATRYE